MATIPISVVICTRNRLEKLRRCLDAFGKVKTEHQWELVVVDNGSTDGTYDYLTSLPAHIANASFQAARDPRGSLSDARNTGVRVSNGDIVACTDDDCYVAPDYIDAMVRAFEDATIGFIGGRIMLYDKTDLPMTIKESDQYEKILPYTFIGTGHVQGANMAFRRSTLEAIGGFDNILGSKVAAEDTDAIANASWAGIPGAYDPGPTVFHHHGRKTKDQAKNTWAFYDRGRGAYYIKYVLNRASRSTYLRAWAKITLAQLHNAPTLKSRFGVLNGVRRELAGALYYVRAKSRSGKYRTGF
jgi:glycosyltransferase involved in cell wall biosynthesis